MFDEYDDVVSIDELRAMLHIGRNTAYFLVNSGKLKSIRIGHQIRINKTDVIAYLSVEPLNNMNGRTLTIDDNAK